MFPRRGDVYAREYMCVVKLCSNWSRIDHLYQAFWYLGNSSRLETRSRSTKSTQEV